MSERVTAEELRRVLDTLEQAAEDHASADRTVASGVLATRGPTPTHEAEAIIEAIQRAIAALERERDEALQELTLWQRAFGPYPLKQLRGGE